MHRSDYQTMRFRSRRSVLLVLAGLAGLLVPSAAQGGAIASAARSVSVNDTAYLHPVHGNALIQEGRAGGTLPGSVKAIFVLGTTTVKTTFTVYVRGGSISGRGSATLHLGHGGYVSFGGSLLVTHGTGRYAHASGSGGLFGTLNRNNNYTAVVQTTGKLHY